MQGREQSRRFYCHKAAFILSDFVEYGWRGCAVRRIFWHYFRHLNAAERHTAWSVPKRFQAHLLNLYRDLHHHIAVRGDQFLQDLFPNLARLRCAARVLVQTRFYQCQYWYSYKNAREFDSELKR